MLSKPARQTLWLRAHLGGASNTAGHRPSWQARPVGRKGRKRSRPLCAVTATRDSRGQHRLLVPLPRPLLRPLLPPLLALLCPAGLPAPPRLSLALGALVKRSSQASPGLCFQVQYKTGRYDRVQFQAKGKKRIKKRGALKTSAEARGKGQEHTAHESGEREQSRAGTPRSQRANLGSRFCSTAAAMVKGGQGKEEKRRKKPMHALSSVGSSAGRPDSLDSSSTFRLSISRVQSQAAA